MIPRLHIISGEASVASVNRAGGLGDALSLLVGGLRGSIKGLKGLDWLKTDLNAGKIITVQDYKRKKINVNGSKHVQC